MTHSPFKACRRDYPLPCGEGLGVGATERPFIVSPPPGLLFAPLTTVHPPRKGEG